MGGEDNNSGHSGFEAIPVGEGSSQVSQQVKGLKTPRTHMKAEEILYPHTAMIRIPEK